MSEPKICPTLMPCSFAKRSNSGIRRPRGGQPWGLCTGQRNMWQFEKPYYGCSDLLAAAVLREMRFPPFRQPRVERLPPNAMIRRLAHLDDDHHHGQKQRQQ